MQEETRAGRKRSCDMGSATSVQTFIHYTVDTGERERKIQGAEQREERIMGDRCVCSAKNITLLTGGQCSPIIR